MYIIILEQGQPHEKAVIRIYFCLFFQFEMFAEAPVVKGSGVREGDEDKK